MWGALSAEEAPALRESGPGQPGESTLAPGQHPPAWDPALIGVCVPQVRSAAPQRPAPAGEDQRGREPALSGEGSAGCALVWSLLKTLTRARGLKARLGVVGLFSMFACLLFLSNTSQILVLFKK